MMDFEGKTVVVTGASKGIGRAIALAFGKSGCDVLVNYKSDVGGAASVADEIRHMDRWSCTYDCDVSNMVQTTKMIDFVAEHFKGIDVLVNNAAIYLDSIVWKMTEDTWDKVIDVNLKGVFNCTKAVVPYMRELGSGRIINITSVVGQTGGFGCSNYAASKAGVIGFTKAVAREVAKFGITVNALALGYIDAGMNLRLPEPVRAEILKSIPLGRWGKVSEVIDAVLFLASDNAGYITGQVLNVNGGCYM